MRKFIRNDYTFIKRLEKIGDKYLAQNNDNSIISTTGTSGLKMYLRIHNFIDEIKEDMRLNALQKINDISLNVKGFTKEEADVYYAALDKIYKPIGVNINDIV